MNQKRLKITLLLITTIFMSACGNILGPTAIPPEQLGTAIVQTAAVLASQTALYAPPTIPGPDNTAIATMEQSPSPTTTGTATPFIIIVETRTPTITETGTATATKTPTETVSQPCVVAALVPANNTQFSSGTFFDTIWTLVNTGSTTWVQGNVDFVYQGGTKMHLNGDILDMPFTTAPNQSLVMVVHMQAPATKGTYSETWSLKEGGTTYCTVSMVIEVK
jgi:uncharacterized protein YceK